MDMNIEYPQVNPVDVTYLDEEEYGPHDVAVIQTYWDAHQKQLARRGGKGPTPVQEEGFGQNTDLVKILAQWPVRLDQGKFKDARPDKDHTTSTHEGLDILVTPGQPTRMPFGGRIVYKGTFYKNDGYHLEVDSGEHRIRVAYLSKDSWDKHYVGEVVKDHQWSVYYERPKQWKDTPDHLHIDVANLREPKKKIHPFYVSGIKNAVERYYRSRNKPVPKQLYSQAEQE